MSETASNPFFSTMEEREQFLRSLAAGHIPVMPGCWFRHAIQATDDLDGEPYRDETILMDCSQIAVVEIEAITGKKLDRFKLMNLPVFGLMVGSMRAKGVDGLRDCIASFSANYEPRTERFKSAQTVPENPSGVVIQQWARLFANWMTQTVRGDETSQSMLDAGRTTAQRLGYDMPADHLEMIWNAMRAARKA